MNREEVLGVARLARAARPHQAWDDATPDVWVKTLWDVRFVDARDVLAEMVKTEAFIDATAIRTRVQLVREARLAAHWKDIPPYHDPDDVAAARAHDVAWRHRIGDGEVPPPAPELPSHPLPDLRALLPSKPAAGAAGRARSIVNPAYKKPCSHCGARAGERCTRDGTDAGRMTRIHDARLTP